MPIKEFEQFNRQIEQELNIYKKRSSYLFDYLKSQAEAGFSKNQFLIYRDNYFYRTISTIPCVSLVVKAAAENEDEATLKSAGQNLSEELGIDSKSSKSHAELLRYSHNTHGEKAFNAAPITLKDSLQSNHVFAATRKFKQIQLSLYTSSDYVEVLAASYAQEEVATEMLSVFYQTFFESRKDIYSTKKEFDLVAEYFTCHLNGLEVRHAEDAKYCLFTHCNSSTKKDIAIHAMSQILHAQSEIWIVLKDKLTTCLLQ